VPTVGNQFALALQHFQAGNTPQAEELLHECLRAEPGNADAHHLFGIIAYQTGRYEQAITSIRKALSLNPRAADCYANLGLAHEALGRVEEAVTHYRHALRIHPEFAEAHTCLGNALLRQHKPTEAMDCYRRALRINPNWAAAHNGRGLVLEQADQLDEAIRCYRQAIRLQPGLAEAHYNLGNALKRQEQLDDAIRCYQEALRLKPNLAEACNNLGGALARQGKHEEATTWYREALRINLLFADAYNGLGHALERQKKFDEAIHSYREALRLDPKHAEAHNGLGCALERQDKVDEAIACYRQAIRLSPNLAEAHNNLGTALERQEKLDEALASYEQAMRLKPGYTAARWNRARLWLLLGNFEQGWPEFEGRWTQTNFVRRAFVQPLWDGSDLGGRTILLYAEQGLGDTLQFVRYAPLAAQRGGKVIVECQPSLVRLLGSLPGIDRLLGQGSPLPAFDVQAPLGSLPGIFRTTLATVPATVPYLHADAELVKHWRRKSRKSEVGSPKSEEVQLTSDIRHPTSDFLVGIAWQGNPAYGFDRQRSIPLTHFASLARVEGVQLVSLQKGPGADQLKQLRIADCGLRIERQETKPLLESAIRNPQSAILDLGSRLDEASGAFMDTAAVMKNLDLVISSDTAVPHLAGALGVPVWVALPLVPDWRWLLKREDSPWYPAMRLFRQTRDGHWEDVFKHLAEELKKVVSC